MSNNKKTYYNQFDIPTSISDNNLQKIIQFYLFECPVPDKSARGKKFADYGFRGQKPFATLKKVMLASATQSLKANYLPCKQEKLEANYRLIEAVSPPNEYCVFLLSYEKNVMYSLFSAIRNAFAHGSFNVKSYNGTRIYFFVNYDKYKKAQIVLQENTLLSWKKIIQSGYIAMLEGKEK